MKKYEKPEVEELEIKETAEAGFGEPLGSGVIYDPSKVY